MDYTISCYVCTDESYECQNLGYTSDIEIDGCDACGVVRGNHYHVFERLCLIGPSCSEVDTSFYTDDKESASFECCENGDYCNETNRIAISKYLAFVTMVAIALTQIGL